MFFKIFNIDITFQIKNKILFEKSFGDALRIALLVIRLASCLTEYVILIKKKSIGVGLNNKSWLDFLSPKASYLTFESSLSKMQVKNLKYSAISI